MTGDNKTNKPRKTDLSVTTSPIEKPLNKFDQVSKGVKMIGLVRIAMAQLTREQINAIDDFIKQPSPRLETIPELMSSLHPNDGDNFNTMPMTGEKGYHLDFDKMQDSARLHNVLMYLSEKIHEKMKSNNSSAALNQDTNEIENLVTLTVILLHKNIQCFETLRISKYFDLLESTWEKVGTSQQHLIESHVERMLSMDPGGYLHGKDISIGQERGYALVQAKECDLRLLYKKKSMNIAPTVEQQKQIRQHAFESVFVKLGDFDNYLEWLTQAAEDKKTSQHSVPLGEKWFKQEFSVLKSVAAKKAKHNFRLLAKSDSFAVVSTCNLVFETVRNAIKYLPKKNHQFSSSVEASSDFPVANEDLFNGSSSQEDNNQQKQPKKKEQQEPPKRADHQEQENAEQEKPEAQARLALRALDSKTATCMALGILAGLFSGNPFVISAAPAIVIAATSAGLFSKQPSGKDDSGPVRQPCP